MKRRNWVLAGLILLSVITYIDRICMAVAGPRIQTDLGFSPAQWGWVMGAFAISYALFEIPTGALCDRIGPRKVLTRIVLWWSAFTALTGIAWSYVWLLVLRFCFGAGEAGAYPSASVAIARWFPNHERARASGLVWMASRAGGAITPFVVLPLQIHFGWRASFFVAGCMGLVWAAAWFFWFRDDPSDMPGITREELAEIRPPTAASHHLPWAMTLRTPTLIALILMYFTYCYGSFFFVSWMPTYLAKSRGFTEKGLLVSTLPFILGACANFCGGFASDYLIRRVGLKWGRRSVGMLGLSVAAVFTLATYATSSQILAVVFLCLSLAGSDFMLPTAWAVCLDIGKTHSGAVSGTMNTAGQIGSFTTSVLFGYFVKLWGYEFPLLIMAFSLALSALAWLWIDPTIQLAPEEAPQLEARVRN